MQKQGHNLYLVVSCGIPVFNVEISDAPNADADLLGSRLFYSTHLYPVILSRLWCTLWKKKIKTAAARDWTTNLPISRCSTISGTATHNRDKKQCLCFSYFTPQWPHHQQPRQKHSHSCRAPAPREIPAVLKTIPCHLTGTQGDKASFTRLLTCQEATQKVYVSAHWGVGGFCQVFLHIFYLCEPIYTHPQDRRDLPAYSFKEHSSFKQRSTA